MEKTVSIHPLGEQPKESVYWRKRSPLERLNAIEALRKLYLEQHGISTEQRLSRVCRIVKQSGS